MSREIPTTDTPLSLARRIDGACRRFEAAWQAGGRPAVEDYLGDLADSDHAACLRELIPLDVHYRRRNGEEPRPADYRERFPALDPAWLAEETVTPLGAAAGVEDEQATDERPTRPGPPAASARAPMPTVPGYELLGKLGQGGMGVVYRARQLRLGRVVALKVLRDGILADPGQVARFHGEARAVASLRHPHVVQIHESGEHDGRPYLVLELVDGGSLAEKLNGTPLPEAHAAELVETLARAMHHAHQNGIVHRDLKPANVLLAPEGTPKVTDFGLAKHLEAEVFLSHTPSGTLLGTPSYMAPEQAWGHTREVGPAADVYALGAILYECLTGRPPFLAERLLGVLEQVRSQEPLPPTRLRAGLPRDLETICLKCLEKEPARRYGSARELAEDLRRFRGGEPIRARPVGLGERGWKWVRRRPAAAALAAMTGLASVLLVSTALLGVAFLQDPPPAVPAAKPDFSSPKDGTLPEGELPPKGGQRVGPRSKVPVQDASQERQAGPVSNN